MPLSPRQSLWFAVGLVSLMLLAYFPAINAGFIWDDDDYVINNDTLRDVPGLVRIWTDPSATPQYYPFVHSTFWLEYQTWGLAAPGYHVVNILIHTINSLLLWRLCRRLEIPAAWLIGLTFAIHPVHVESVAWITERKNVLSGLFYLSSAHAYLRHAGLLKRDDRVTDQESRLRWYVLSLVLFAAALLSKTVTSTLPAALLVVIWWKLGTIPRQRIIDLSPMFAIGIGFGMLTVWLEKYQVGAEGMDWQLTIVERILVAGRVICFYAGKLLFPIDLIFTYPRWDIDAGVAWQYLYPALVLAMIIGLYRLRGRIGRGPVAALCFFCGTLFPALGFFDVYPMRFSFVADHFQYLASIGLIVLYVQVGIAVSNRVTRSSDHSATTGQRVAVAALTIMLAALTWKQTLIYANLETLWRDTIARNPTSWMAHNNLGALLNRRGDFVEAETHLIEAIKLKPRFADSVSNLGKAREGQGDLVGAQRLYEEAVEISPRDAKALNNLAAVYGMTGRIDESREMVERALASNPKLGSAYGNLGTLEAVQGNFEAATKNYQRCLELDPSDVEIRLNLARIYLQQSSFSAAESELRIILEQSPRNTAALLNLGVTQVNQNELTAALTTFERVLELEPSNVPAMRNLAYTYQQLGRSEQADAIAAAADRIEQGSRVP